MKKFLSVLLTLTMLLGTLSVSFNALAATKAEAPVIKAGDTLDLSIAPIDEKKYEELIGDPANVDEAALKEIAEAADIWYGKFTPEADGWYEVAFDTKYECKGISDESGMSMAMGAAQFVKDGDDDAYGTGMSMNFNIPDSTDAEELEFLKAMLEMMELGDRPSFTCELKKGQTYYLQISNISAEAYNTKVTVKAHTHQMKDAYEKATVYYDKDWDMVDSEEGFKGKRCACDYCEYEEGKEIPFVDDILVKSATYTGKKLTPKVTVKLYNGKTLSAKNYTVKYSNNKKVGSGKATLTFKGDYEGKVTVRFKIKPKATAIKKVKKAGKKSVSVRWKKKTAQVSGYQIQYSTSSKFKNAKKVTVKGAKKTKKTIKKLKKGKKYYFRIRTYKVVNGDRYYSKWSKAKKVKL